MLAKPIPPPNTVVPSCQQWPPLPISNRRRTLEFFPIVVFFFFVFFFLFFFFFFFFFLLFLIYLPGYWVSSSDYPFPPPRFLPSSALPLPGCPFVFFMPSSYSSRLSSLIRTSAASVCTQCPLPHPCISPDIASFPLFLEVLCSAFILSFMARDSSFISVYSGVA